MIFKIIYYVFLAILCLRFDKQFWKASEQKDLNDQIKYGIYLMIGMMALYSSY